MPVTRTATRAKRKSAYKQVINLRRWRKLRSAIKSFTDAPSDKALQAAMSAVDKASKYNMIHKNKASRMKSKFSSMLAS